jgi:TatD DNase family protein
MIAAAQESSLPLIVHTREADSDMCEILHSAYKNKPFSGVIHCYSSGPDVAQTALEIGFYISASGMITFNKSDDIRARFKQIPPDRLLVETDSPYLAPVPFRGQTNEPAYVVKTAQKLAELKETDFETISAITTENFYRLFQKASKFRQNANE